MIKYQTAVVLGNNSQNTQKLSVACELVNFRLFLLFENAAASNVMSPLILINLGSHDYSRYIAKQLRGVLSILVAISE